MNSMHSMAQSIFTDNETAGGDIIYFEKAKFSAGDIVWVRGDKKTIWDRGTVFAAGDDQTDAMVAVRTENGREFLTRKAYGGELMPEGDGKAGYKDMTAMRYVNEPQILENLRVRSLGDKPYTFLGPVLVAVNPLKPLKAELEAGDRKCMTLAHPYAVAELAYQQMTFVLRRPDEAAESPANQTIIVSGESGAGKTVSSKMVLAHLVARSGGGDLAKAMLSSNPIMEAFGNATTLRNPNSSRFGKLLKVHYNKEGEAIVGASMGTYLLERSRITSHELGERNYHSFYQLLAGGEAGLLSDLFLDKNEKYKILLAKSKAKKEPTVTFHDDDAANYKEMTDALKHVGVDGDNFTNVVKVLGAVLNLGNIEFDDEETNEGKKAHVSAGSQKHLEGAATLLGVDKTSLEKAFTELERKVGGQVIVSFVEGENAAQLLDGVCKALYSRLFNWTVNTINLHLNKQGGDDLPTIGVLDIFGFETFARNDLEQLLINYTNESLQLTFNKQVLEAEAALYQREGLAISEEDKVALDPTQVVDSSNKRCIELLQGVSVPQEKGKKKSAGVPGVLTIIHEQGRIPKPTEKKLIEKLHKTFQSQGGRNNMYPNYMTVKKRMRTQFTIKHYAGKVAYTVGNFLAKNNDMLPKATTELFKSSTSELVRAVWDCSDTSGRKKDSIVSKFVKQIKGLSDDLNATQCAFIRCIKPNALMTRAEGWFDRRYITKQLKNLSIPKTADVLKSGLPTRIPYAQLVQSYATIFGGEVKAPDADDERGVKQFIAALFYAFEIERSAYKLGLTRVFFKTGELDKLDEVLNAADEWTKGDHSDDPHRTNVLVRFKTYMNRRRWRVVFAYFFASRMFTRQLHELRDQKEKELKASILIQSVFRGYSARLKFIAILEAKRLEEERKAREEAERKRIEAERIAEEKRQKEIEKQAQLRAFKEERRRQRKLAQEKRDRINKALAKASAEAAEEEKKKLDKQREEDAARLAKEKAEEEEKQKELEKLRLEREEQERLAEEEKKKEAKARAIEQQKKNKLYMDRMLERRKADMKKHLDGIGNPRAAERQAQIKATKSLVDAVADVKEKQMDENMEKRIQQIEEEIEEDIQEEIEELTKAHDLLDALFDEDEAEKMNDVNFMAELQDDDYSDYGSLSDSDDDDYGNSKLREAVQTIAVNKGLSTTEYVGPFRAFVNDAKLRQKKTGRKLRLPRNLKNWKECFAFVYPNTGHLLLNFVAQDDTRHYQFMQSTGKVSVDTTVKEFASSYQGRKNVIQISNVKEMSQSEGNLLEVILAFNDRNISLDFLNALSACTKREEEMMASAISSTDTGTGNIKTMTMAQRKNRKNNIRSDLLKKVAILRRGFKDQDIPNERLQKILEENEEEDEEDDEEEDTVVFCNSCLQSTVVFLGEDENRCQHCNEPV